MRIGQAAIALVALGLIAVGGGVAAQAARPDGLRSSPAQATDPDIHKIKHVIVIMQENRSFDSYFGTFPGADGIPAGVCLPDPRNGGCRRPWVDHHDSNGNDPHNDVAFKTDVDGGKMDGYVA